MKWYTDIGMWIIWSVKWHHILKKMLDYYDGLDLEKESPLIIWDILKKNIEQTYKLKLEYKKQIIDDIKIYTADYFYPYYYGRSLHRKEDIKENTYAIHHWNNSCWYTNKKEWYKFSIIIPHLNEGYYLDIMLDSFYNYLKYDNYEIIVCDDGSDNLSCLDFLENHFLKDKIKVYKNNNLWLANNKNFWASKASWDILIFLDSHMYIKEDFLQKLNYIFKYNSYISLLQPIVWSIADKNVNWKIYKIKNYNLTSTWDGIKWSWLNLVETPNIAWWAMIVKKEVFDKLWWFNKFFRKWWAEDLEFSMRAWLSGYFCYLTKDIKINHYFKESFKNTVVKSEDVFYNKLIFAKTCFLNPERQNNIINELREHYKNDDVYYELINDVYVNDYIKEKQSLFVYNDDWYFKKFARYYNNL